MGAYLGLKRYFLSNLLDLMEKIKMKMFKIAEIKVRNHETLEIFMR